MKRNLTYAYGDYTEYALFHFGEMIKFVECTKRWKSFYQQKKK